MGSYVEGSSQQGDGEKAYRSRMFVELHQIQTLMKFSDINS